MENCICIYTSEKTKNTSLLMFYFSWRENLRNEADMKSCVTIQCFQYPATADVCYNEVVEKSSVSFIPCEQFAVSHGFSLNITGTLKTKYFK